MDPVSIPSLLENYEQQYAILSADITSKIGKLSSGNERLKTIAEIEKLIEDAQELMEQMELEVRGLESHARSKFTNRIFSYKAELNRLGLEFSKVKYRTSKHKAGDSSLGLYADYGNIQMEQKQRLLDTSEQIEQSGKHLMNGYRIAVETEQIGSQMLNDLHSQRETIKCSLNRLHETNDDISMSSRLISTIMNRSIRHKVILWCLGGIFTVIITYTIYCKIL